MSVAGIYDCVSKTPMGDQKSVLTLQVDGDTVTGSNVGDLGANQLMDGKLDGNHVTWHTKLSSPIAITLECEATIDGDQLTGSAKAGAFGTFGMTGTKRA